MKIDKNTKHIFGKYSIEIRETNLSAILNTKIVPIIRTFGIGYDKWVHIAFSKTKTGKFYIFKNGFSVASTIALEKKIEKLLDIKATSKEWSVYFWIRLTDETGLGYWLDEFTIRMKPFNPKYEIGDKLVGFENCNWESNFTIPKGD